MKKKKQQQQNIIMTDKFQQVGSELGFKVISELECDMVSVCDGGKNGLIE